MVWGRGCRKWYVHENLYVFELGRGFTVSGVIMNFYVISFKLNEKKHLHLYEYIHLSTMQSTSPLAADILI